MTITFRKNFQKEFQSLPAAIQKKALRQIRLLANDIRHPGVHARKMTGVGDVWEGRVDQNYRFTFEIIGDSLIFRRIGTHDVYRKP